MLRSFFVKDYVLIEEIKIEFGKGLNIITGETGAGKSILIDAMGLLLGGRASSDIIRKGASKAIVEGIFESSGKYINSFLDENQIDRTDELILRRELSLKGNNRSFINDTPVSLNIYKELGNLLVDLHGQHEHQSLLRTETHIDFLDQYADPGTDMSQYQNYYPELRKHQSGLRELYKRETEFKEKHDFYSFQIREIDNIDPGLNEDENVSDELKILENSERLLELTGEIYEKTYNSDDALYDQLVKVNNDIKEIAKIDKQFEEVSGECENALGLIKDIADFVRDYNSKISLEPGRLESLRSRLGVLLSLRKKYGGSIKSVMEYREKIGMEFELADNFSGKIIEIENLITELKKKCASAAEKISARRSKAALKIKKEVAEYLDDLGITGATFEVRISRNTSKDETSDHLICSGEKVLYNSSGIDEVEFFISTNPGEDIKPLAKVASGGEVSRIMLALKSVLAKSEKLPLLIFDEIDTGISGRIAQKAGGALKKLSEFHQVIAITHLPQIAGQADVHFAVEKAVTGERVVSSIRKLNSKQRVEEVAKLISGENVTEASLRGARELMGV